MESFHAVCPYPLHSKDSCSLDPFAMHSTRCCFPVSEPWLCCSFCVNHITSLWSCGSSLLWVVELSLLILGSVCGGVWHRVLCSQCWVDPTAWICPSSPVSMETLLLCFSECLEYFLRLTIELTPLCSAPLPFPVTAVENPLSQIL